MRAVVQERYGTEPGEVLGVEEIERPEPGEGEVLVEVRAAAVDRGVLHLMSGHPYLVRLAGYGFRAPKSPVPGSDLAGVVVAVGEGVTGFSPGDEVFGIGRGSFAEFAVAEAEKLVPKPANLTFEQAASLPISGLTALQAVRDEVAVQQGESLLVLGAGGGVGSWAVQVAKARGAEVTGVAGPAKQDLVRRLGADRAVDYTQEGIQDLGRRFDAIIDTGGNRPIRELRGALMPEGRLVIVGGENGGRWLGGTQRQLRAMLLNPFVGQKLGTFISEESGSDLRELVALVESGAISPAIDSSYELAEAAEAIARVGRDEARGKIVLSVAG